MEKKACSNSNVADKKKRKWYASCLLYHSRLRSCIYLVTYGSRHFEEVTMLCLTKCFCFSKIELFYGGMLTSSFCFSFCDSWGHILLIFFHCFWICEIFLDGSIKRVIIDEATLLKWLLIHRTFSYWSNKNTGVPLDLASSWNLLYLLWNILKQERSFKYTTC